MKAEERKELETNILADRMGKMLTKAKGGPGRSTVLFVVSALIGLGILTLWMWINQAGSRESSQAWLEIDVMPTQFIVGGQSNQYMQRIADYTQQTKIMRFDRAHYKMWF